MLFTLLLSENIIRSITNDHLNSNEPQIYIYGSDVSLMLSTYIIFNINPEHTISILDLTYIEIILYSRFLSVFS